MDSLNDAVTQAETAGISLGEFALRREVAHGLKSRAELEAGLTRALEVMRGALAEG